MITKSAVVVLLLICSVSASAQEQNGKIVFYREPHFIDYDYKPLLFCDGVELGRIMSDSYMEVAAQPGHHSCVAESDQAAETIIEIVAGSVAYQRIIITPTVKRHAVLTASNEGEYRRQKKLTRIMTGELGSVQPLVPTDPHLPIILANVDSNESSAIGTGLEGTFHPGVGGVTYPMCIRCTDLKYTEQARRAKLNGTVGLKATIGVDGKARDIAIVKSLGKGLDEQAVNTVQAWIFKPALRPNGQPVGVVVPIEITFRLLK